MYRLTRVKPWFSWNQMENVQFFSLCRNGTFLIELPWNGGTLWCFSGSIKKLKLRMWKLEMFSAQNRTRITGWGKWVIPRLAWTLGSQKDEELECSSESRAASSSPLYLCKQWEKTNCSFCTTSKESSRCVFYVAQAYPLYSVLLWPQISHCLSMFGHLDYWW